VRPGDRVAILAGTSLAYPVVALGVLKSGATLLPLNFRYQADELAWVLGDARPSLLFVESSCQELARAALAAIALPVPLVPIPGATDPENWSWLDFAAGGAARVLPGHLDPESAAALMYTSGTTGRPKGVLFPHRGYFATFHALIVEGDIQPGEITLVNMPLFHQAGLFAMVLPTWMRGGTVVLGAGSFDPAQVLQAVQEQRITLTMWVPTMLARLLDAPGLDRYDLSSLGKIYYGSAPMGGALYARARAAFAARFYQWYGLTETGLNAILRPEDHVAHAGCTGREVFNCELRIVDGEREVETGEAGELQVAAGPHGMIGYLGQPEATAEALRDGWIRTGDVARREAGGLFTIVDRSKDMIISGGENIYPREVEDVLRGHPAVADVAVFGVPDAIYGEAVCAAIVRGDGGDPSPAELMQYCAARLASYKKPKRVVFLTELPRNAMGKVAKGVLRAPYWQGRERQV
jgi:acyl-CoA synthetase (AMP-forming)/AMP-acid ligase II